MVTQLLQLALALLIAAQSPNVPENVKIQAIETANMAIAYAMTPTALEAPTRQISPQATFSESPTQVNTPEQAPTCSLSVALVTKTAENPTLAEGMMFARATWDSENATSFEMSKDGTPLKFNFSEYNVPEITKHWVAPFIFVTSSSTISVKFTGPGGVTTCEQII